MVPCRTRGKSALDIIEISIRFFVSTVVSGLVFGQQGLLAPGADRLDEKDQAAEVVAALPHAAMTLRNGVDRSAGRAPHDRGLLLHGSLLGNITTTGSAA